MSVQNTGVAPADGLHAAHDELMSIDIDAARSDPVMAADVAAIRASRLSAASTRTSSALHSLMEQGGRVELVLASHDHSPLTRTIGDLSHGTQYTLPLSSSPLTANFPESTPEEPHLLDIPSNSSTVKSPAMSERPTYVPIPSRQSFNFDNDPAAVSTSASASHQRSNSVHTPSTSSHSVMFEPGVEVLVVDDDSLTRTLMKRLLTRLGCKVSTAENGEVALEMILGGHIRSTPSTDWSGPILDQVPLTRNDEGRYSVIFLDNQMPVLSGLQAVAKLRQLGRSDFVVGVTGELAHTLMPLSADVLIVRKRTAFRPTRIPRGRG
jgi:osomolarity two-component system, sensor histidine kinase SLN1